MTFFFKAAAVGLLALGLADATWAMTPGEAQAAIRRAARDESLRAKDVSQAVSTLDELIAKGVPVDHAYDIVKAAIDDGIRGKELAAIARKSPMQAQAEMKDDIMSPTRGEFGQSGGLARAGREMGRSPGGALGGRRP